jgi:hypothetical protein
MPDLRTIEGVELARVGTYDLSTGPMTFTREHLASAVENAGQGAAARIRIGHQDPRFDGSPAIGRVANLRLDDDGDLLVGDLVDVPDWLADALPDIYPGRSIEARVRDDSMRLTGLALLGATAPGIDSLADLERLVAAAGAHATIVHGQDADGHEITVALPASEADGKAIAAAAPARTAERVSQEWHRQSGDDGWVREVRLDPFEVITSRYSMGGERLYRVPFTFNDDDTVAFGDPVEVVVQYVDRTSASVAAAAVYTSRDEYVAAAGSTPQEKESTVDPKKLRADLGLPEDAPDDKVSETLAELAARPTPEQVAEQVAAAKKPVDGVVTVEASQWEETAEYVKAAKQRDREEFVAAAVSAGKIPPARKDHWLGYMERDEQGAREAIDGLKPIVPVSELGGAGSDIEAAADPAAGDDYWFAGVPTPAATEA